ncbi:hypothetical protein BH09PSE4_BH09PSE4_05200 [soil metagenome]
MSPEFSRPERLDAIGAGERDVTIAADSGERAALAARFGLVAIERLEARFGLRKDAAGIRARGRLSAALTQACVVTEDSIPVTLDEDFDLRFIPEPDAPDDDEIELSEDSCDVVFFTGGAIDLGEAAAETMALALDPFPRGPRAAEVLAEAGVVAEEDAKPIGALAGLKDMLKWR